MVLPQSRNEYLTTSENKSAAFDSSSRLERVLETKGKSLNRWNIPKSLEDEVVERDSKCVYCGVSFRKSDATFRERPSWEHIVNDATMISRENIALCCRGCNSSKGTKDLIQWLESTYCKSRGITVDTVSEVVRDAIRRKKFAP